MGAGAGGKCSALLRSVCGGIIRGTKQLRRKNFYQNLLHFFLEHFRFI